MPAPFLAKLDGLPEEGSTIAPQYDQLWLFLLLMTAFFTVLIMGLLIVFVVKHRQRNKADRATYSKGATHSTPLELTWIVVPTVIVIALFVFGFKIYLDMNQAPSNAYDVRVLAWQWDWQFRYPDGVRANALHVPPDQPIRVTLESNDVIHSFSVPAFRVKKDVVPGRYNKAWFEAPWKDDPYLIQKLGEVEPDTADNLKDMNVIAYPLNCTEFCGTGHSTMNTTVVVHESEADFIKWKKAQEAEPTWQLGKKVFQQQCKSCHIAEGEGSAIGPTWDDKYGATEQIVGQGSVKVDDEYIRESIIYPNRKIVEGYQGGQAMSAFGNVLSENQIRGVIEYMKYISDNYDGKVLGAQQNGTESESSDGSSGDSESQSSQ